MRSRLAIALCVLIPSVAIVFAQAPKVDSPKPASAVVLTIPSIAPDSDSVCLPNNDCLTLGELKGLVAGRKAAAASVTALAQAQQNVEAMKQSFASVNDKLGECEQVTGGLRKLQSALVKGDFVDWGTVKATVEAANPGKTFDVATHILK